MEEVSNNYKYVKIEYTCYPGFSKYICTCSWVLYGSNDNEEWDTLAYNKASSTETTYMHLFNHCVKQSRAACRRLKLCPDVVFCVCKNLSTYLYVSRFLRTYGWASVINLEKSTKSLRHINEEGNRLVVQLGALDKPLTKTNPRVHFEDAGLVNNEFCEEQRKKRKNLGLWDYGN